LVQNGINVSAEKIQAPDSRAGIALRPGAKLPN
jgi:hypothetical protein